MSIPQPAPKTSRIARIQKAWTLTSLLFICGVAWVMWPNHPWLAIVAALLLGALHVFLLGLEFLLLPKLNRADPAPKLGRGRLWRAWMRESLQCYRVFAWRQPFGWHQIPDRLEGDGVSGRRGVVLVHGFYCNRGFWRPWLTRLVDDRRAFVAVNLEPPFSSIDRYAPLLEDAVARVRIATGLPPLLVCHSMGGLAVRAWLARQATDGKDMTGQVDRVVTIGSPHAGTWMARFSRARNGMQMRIGSPWLQELGRAWAEGNSGVPPERFTCWYSNADNIVVPSSTATLPGAVNRLVPGAAHLDLAFRSEVMEQTLGLLDESS